MEIPLNLVSENLKVHYLLAKYSQASYNLWETIFIYKMKETMTTFFIYLLV